MPAPKRTSTPKPAAKRTGAAARSGAKATATSAKKAGSRTATQAKSGATKTAGSAKSGAAKTKRAAQSGGASATARSAGRAASSTAKTAKSGAKGTATAASAGAKQTRTTAKGAATKTRRASGDSSVAEQVKKGTVKPQDVLVLTRERIQEALDDAAARGRMTRKDANDLVSELVKRGKHHGDELRKELDGLVDRGREGLESAGKRARKVPVADRVVRSADRARRAAGVGPSFPILGYDGLNASQIQARIGDLSKPDARKVLTYEKNHANRKTVTSALEKALA